MRHMIKQHCLKKTELNYSSQRVVVDILAQLKRRALHFNHSDVAQQQLSVIQVYFSGGYSMFL